MPKSAPVARLVFAFALTMGMAACQFDNGRTIVETSRRNGQWQIDSRVTVSVKQARFECRHSASGRCWYTLFGGCGARATSECDATALKRFSVAAGAQVSLDAPPDVDVCVTTSDTHVGRDCKPLPSG